MAAAEKNKVTETNSFEPTLAEPPATRSSGTGTAEHRKIAEFLKANQGQSALVKQGAKNDGLAAAIRKSSAVAFRDGEYTARSNRRPDGTFDIYATYKGPRSAE